METRVKTTKTGTLPAKISLKRAEMYRVCELIKPRISETAGVVVYKDGATDATIAMQAADILKNSAITPAVIARVRKQVFGPLADESGSMKNKLSAIMAHMTQLAKHSAALEKRLDDALRRIDTLENELTEPHPQPRPPSQQPPLRNGQHR